MYHLKKASPKNVELEAVAEAMMQYVLRLAP